MILKIRYEKQNAKLDVLIDEEDFDRVNQHDWYIRKGQYDFYAYYAENYQVIKMANFILNISNDLIVDHINRNTLDNQKSNLRVCTRSQNGANRGIQANNTTGYKGVTYDKKSKFYMVRIRHYSKLIYIMCTKDPIVGAKAYDKKAKELFGEFAKLNFPEEL